ncbi:MAG: FtsL-like putative cell division protein [Deltaproteobacteria bacterium]
MNKNWLNIVIKNLSFIVFVAFLGVIYITNVHLAERKMIKIEKMEKDVEALRYKYMDVKQSLLYTSAPSIIEKRVVDKGLKQTTRAPQVLKNEKN